MIVRISSTSIYTFNNLSSLSGLLELKCKILWNICILYDLEEWTYLLFIIHRQTFFIIRCMILDLCQNMIFFFSHWSGFWWVWRKRIWVARSFWAHFIYRMYLGRRSYQRLCTIWFWLCYWFLLFVCLLGSFANFLLQINVTYNKFFQFYCLVYFIGGTYYS